MGAAAEHSHGTNAGDMAAHCPMAVPGTSVRAEDVEGGVAMVFTTQGDVTELRRRVVHMGEMHAKHHAAGHDHGMGMHGAKTGAAGSGPGPGCGAGGGPGQGEHGCMKGGGMMGGGMMGGGMMGGGMMGGGMMPPADLKSEEVDGGARLIFTPRDAADLAKLREHVRRHAGHVTAGRCPMMSMHGAPDAAPASTSGRESHHPKP